MTIFFQTVNGQLKTAEELVSKAARARRIIVFDATDPLRGALRALTEVDHRALVRIEKDEQTFHSSYRMLSQMDIVRYLYKNIDYLQDYADKRIEEIGLVNPLGNSVVSITTTNRTATAFYKMFYNQVNAVAVIDDVGRIVANLSASDLRGLTSDKLSYLKLPPLQFLEKMNIGRKPAHVVTCSSHELLSGVIAKAVTSNVHRVWVTNSAQNPIGVVTLTDILRTFYVPSQSV